MSRGVLHKIALLGAVTCSLSAVNYLLSEVTYPFRTVSAFKVVHTSCAKQSLCRTLQLVQFNVVVICSLLSCVPQKVGLVIIR
jgi:hypothetical protein